MVFDYYRKLSRADRRIYNDSDRIHAVRLPASHGLHPVINQIKTALIQEDAKKVQRSTARLCAGICEGFSISVVTVKVLAQRPSDDWGELYGLYEGREGRKRAVITLWMRTAQKRNVVALKTYLRTAFHELCHHLDYEYYQLQDSFHTQGFYQRESSLYKQLVTDTSTTPASSANIPVNKKTPRAPPAKRTFSEPVQQELF